jgi:hypothetical protein
MPVKQGFPEGDGVDNVLASPLRCLPDEKILTESDI